MTSYVNISLPLNELILTWLCPSSSSLCSWSLLGQAVDQLGRTRGSAGQWETTEPGLGELSSSLSFPYGQAARELMSIKQGFFFFWHKYFSLKIFIWLYWVLLSCSMWDLVPWPGIQPETPSLGTWSLSHWTTTEVFSPQAGTLNPHNNNMRLNH